MEQILKLGSANDEAKERELLYCHWLLTRAMGSLQSLIDDLENTEDFFSFNEFIKNDDFNATIEFIEYHILDLQNRIKNICLMPVVSRER